MTIPAERLREGTQIFVTGNISFSRLAKLIEGAALARSIEQAQKRNALYPTKVPHTTISLVNASILTAPGAAMTPEEEFVANQIYDIRSGENAGRKGYNIDNKSTYLPTILEPDAENPGAHKQLVLDRDLATGLSVTLVLEVFKPKDYEKRGIGLQQVILNEPARYYASGGINPEALKARGIVVNGPIVAVSGAEAAAQVVDPAFAQQQFAQEAALSGFAVPVNSGVDANGYAMPMPGATGTVPAQVVAAQVPGVAPVAVPPQVAQVAAPAVAAQVPVAAAAPVGQVPVQESPAEELARLRAQTAALQAATANSGGASAFDGVPATAAAGSPSPWDGPTQGGPAAYQG